MKVSDFVNQGAGVQLTTLHSSKGMEFDVVIIGGVENIRLDDNGRRLLYVGTTRAEREVCFVYSKVRDQRGALTTPKYIQDLIATCSDYRYFFHHPLKAS